MSRKKETAPGNDDGDRLEPEKQGAPAATPPPPTPEEIEGLRVAATERDEFLEKLQRTAAEFANYQKRMQRERSEAARYGAQEFATPMLQVLDNLELALKSAETSRDVEKLLDGVKLVERHFEKTLADHGITPIETENRKFDPTLHEAVMRQERNDVPEGTIVGVVRRGFRLHDRVIRPAQVAIAMKSESSGGDSRKDD